MSISVIVSLPTIFNDEYNEYISPRRWSSLSRCGYRSTYLPSSWNKIRGSFEACHSWRKWSFWLGHDTNHPFDQIRSFFPWYSLILLFYLLVMNMGSDQFFFSYESLSFQLFTGLAFVRFINSREVPWNYNGQILSSPIRMSHYQLYISSPRGWKCHTSQSNSVSFTRLSYCFCIRLKSCIISSLRSSGRKWIISMRIDSNLCKFRFPIETNYSPRALGWSGAPLGYGRREEGGWVGGGVVPGANKHAWTQRLLIINRKTILNKFVPTQWFRKRCMLKQFALAVDGDIKTQLLGRRLLPISDSNLSSENSANSLWSRYFRAYYLQSNRNCKKSKQPKWRIFLSNAIVEQFGNRHRLFDKMESLIWKLRLNEWQFPNSFLGHWDNETVFLVNWPISPVKEWLRSLCSPIQLNLLIPKKKIHI